MEGMTEGGCRREFIGKQLMDVEVVVIRDTGWTVGGRGRRIRRGKLLNMKMKELIEMRW